MTENEPGDVKKMTNISKSLQGHFLNADAVSRSATKRIVIMDAGEYKTVTFDGVPKESFYLGVSMDKQEFEYRPNKDSLKNLSDAWGVLTDAWIGKVADVKRLTMNGKDAVIAIPIN